MPADGQTTKFLYTILKQLDLKSVRIPLLPLVRFLFCGRIDVDMQQVDWNLVASQLEITNGHAARMRFSRFRQHIEGIPVNSRTPRTPRPKKPKAAEKPKSKKAMLEEMRPQPPPTPTPVIKLEPFIKPEPGMEAMGYPSGMSSIPMANTTAATSSAQQVFYYPVHNPSTVAPSDLTLRYPAPEPTFGYSKPPIGENWVPVKTEKDGEEVIMQDVFIKKESAN